MNLELARTVADAVLYEGYLLYPYRASSSKNRVRWQFGVLGPPRAWRDGAGEEPAMHAECLLRPRRDARLSVYLRFLQLQARRVEQADPAGPDGFRFVEHLQVGDTDLLSWDEAVEREARLGPFILDELISGVDVAVNIPGGQEIEAVVLPDGRSGGRVMRRRWALQANVHLEIGAIDTASDAVRLAVHAENTSSVQASSRDEATRVSFLGAHLLMQVDQAAFVSLLEPPDELLAQAAACENRRCWPVLVGVEGQADVVLASPIILYDYPAVAPESAGPLFDSTEIDEILTLRVMTLTDDEKAAARATDPAAAAIIERCEQMTPEAMQQLHGVLRDPHVPLSTAWSDAAGVRVDAQQSVAFPDEVPTFTTLPDGVEGGEAQPPWWDPGVDAAVSPSTDVVMVGGVAVAKGSSVVLHPKRNADAQDLFFAGRTATVSAIFFDVDGATHIAVVIDDDPAADLHEWYGRYLYFAPDEIEPLERAG